MRPFSSSLLVILLQLCSISLGAASSTPPIILAQSSNASNSYHSTLLAHLNALPANPAYYRIPRSTLALKLSNYRRTLPQKDLLACLLQASNMANEKLYAGVVGPIGRDVVQTDSGVAHLFVFPDEVMTWGMFGTAIRGLTDFVMEWEYVELDFEIGETGHTGNVGNGLLFYV